MLVFVVRGRRFKSLSQRDESAKQREFQEKIVEETRLDKL